MATHQTEVPLRDQLDALMPQFTASERKVAAVLLADYPYGGLAPIRELARRAKVSAPSVTRFVAKIGCAGYQDFQRRLIGALKARELSPLELKLTEQPLKAGHFLTDYTHRLIRLMTQMADGMPIQPFDELCALLADHSRSVYVLGGRVSDTIAQLLSVHLHQMRARVFHIPTDPEKWPDYVLQMRRRDVVLIFDIRRYEPRLDELAEVIVRTSGAFIVALTDQWMSPVARNATHVFALPTDLDTPWQSQICLVTLVEAIIIRVSESNWDATRKRIGQWDAIRFGTAGRR
ncbi:MAG: RpiR family transcriptional regulator [Cereibacter sphaeroides]|uniref:RpiR family transcriptional regulator n=1 Tax=Cereibacter sphaeroides TaxID=1063 RepID=A0A2W5S9X6_CERSP|nr:MAG: RpiR family transcriptional regulator [Cereibacter sphaeroides]